MHGPLGVLIWVCAMQAAHALNILALVNCGSKTDDGGFNKQLESALQSSLKNHSDLVFEISNSIACSAASAQTAQYKEYDMVILNGFNVRFPLDEAQVFTNNAKTRFVMIDQVPLPTDPANVQGVVFKEDEGAFAAGVVAGLQSKTQVIGGIFGTPFAPLKRFRNGFINGVRAVCPSCTTITQYAHTFSSQQVGSRLCRYLIDQGADIIFAAAGETGVGALLEASQRRTLSIGADLDQFQTVFNESQDGRFMLTSAMKNVQVAVQRAINNFYDGVFPKAIEMSLGNGGISLADCHLTCNLITTQTIRARDSTLAKIQANILRTGVSSSTGQQEAFSNYSPNSWNEVQAFGRGPGTSLVGAAAASAQVLGDRTGIVFGGSKLDTSEASNSLFLFNADSMAWLEHTQNNSIATQWPMERRHATLVQISPGQTLLVGGVRGKELLTDVWLFSQPDSDQGIPLLKVEELPAIPANMPARQSPCSASAFGIAYVYGGTDAQGNSLSDLWSFELKTAKWTLMCSECRPGGREGASLSFDPVRKGLILHGGQRAGALLSDTWGLRVTSTGFEFSRLPDAPVARAFHQAKLLRVRLPGKKEKSTVLALTGGKLEDSVSARRKKSVAYFSGDSWTLVASFQPNSACQNEQVGEYSPREQHVAISLGDSLLVFGGTYISPSLKSAQLEIYSPSENQQDENANRVSEGVVILQYILFGLLESTAIGLICWTYVKRNHPVVRASQRQFLSMVTVGCMISGLTIVAVTYMDDASDQGRETTADDGYLPADVACNATVWLYGTGFIVTFVPLFAKMWRVHKIFSNTKLKKIRITSKQLASICAVLLLFEWTILTIMTVFSPLEYVRIPNVIDEFGNVLSSTGTCTSDRGMLFLGLMFGFHVAVLFYGNYLAWIARKIDDKFAESKGITICLIANLQVLALSTPVLVIVYGNPTAAAAIISGVIFLNSMTVLLALFLPKMRMVAKHPEELALESSDRKANTSNAQGSSSFERQASVSQLPASHMRTYSDADLEVSSAVSSVVFTPSPSVPVPPVSSHNQKVFRLG